MSAFGLDRETVRSGMTGAQGWVYYNWAIENEIGMLGARYERTTPGYVRQEADRIARNKK